MSSASIDGRRWSRAWKRCWNAWPKRAGSADQHRLDPHAKEPAVGGAGLELRRQKAALDRHREGPHERLVLVGKPFACVERQRGGLARLQRVLVALPAEAHRAADGHRARL